MNARNPVLSGVRTPLMMPSTMLGDEHGDHQEDERADVLGELLPAVADGGTDVELRHLAAAAAPP